ncbi:hypothetical protein BH10PSE12_BH10PSE12_14750 [soil metagenome]
MIVLNVDDFRHINERHGPLVGDRMLRQLAERLRIAVGTEGSLGYLGADEFACSISPADDAAVSAIVTDAQGFSYVVGTTAGDVGYSRWDGEDDLFLTKMDSEGKVVWQRALGAAGTAQGAAISLAANGDIVVASSAQGFAGTTSDDTDILVTRFGSNGDEQFSTTIGGLGNDSASAVTIGADGSIYVAGKTSTSGGDAYIARPSATGKMVEKRTLPDSGGNDVVTALATDASGNLLVLSRENGEAKLN